MSDWRQQHNTKTISDGQRKTYEDRGMATDYGVDPSSDAMVVLLSTRKMVVRMVRVKLQMKNKRFFGITDYFLRAIMDILAVKRSF